MVGGAVGGAVFAMTGAKAYTMGGLGIFGVVNYISPQGDASGMYASFICIAVSMVIGFILTLLFWQDAAPVETVSQQPKNTLKVERDSVMAPLSGTVIPMNELKDDAFSQGVLGKGVGIEPTDGKVLSPVDGTVTTLFPTLHAIGLTADSGIELLIHIGLDTVQMGGKGFTAHIKEGDRVKKGQHIMDVDLNAVKAAGFSTQTPVIVTNSSDLLDIIPLDNKTVQAGNELITVLF